MIIFNKDYSEFYFNKSLKFLELKENHNVLVQKVTVMNNSIFQYFKVDKKSLISVIILKRNTYLKFC